jgi:rhodanese-related sulfurtransferase
MAATVSSPTHINADLRALLARRRETLLLDVRSPGEFAGVHIENAKIMPLEELRKHVGEVRDRVQGRPVTVICAQGVRAADGGKALAGRWTARFASSPAR